MKLVTIVLADGTEVPGYETILPSGEKIRSVNRAGLGKPFSLRAVRPVTLRPVPPKPVDESGDDAVTVIRMRIRADAVAYLERLVELLIRFERREESNAYPDRTLAPRLMTSAEIAGARYSTGREEEET